MIKNTLLGIIVLISVTSQSWGCEASFSGDSFLSIQMTIDRLLRAQRGSRSSVEIYIQEQVRQPLHALNYDEKVNLLIGAEHKLEAVFDYFNREEILPRKVSKDRIEVRLDVREMINFIMAFDPYDYDGNLLYQESFGTFMMTLD